MPLSTKENKPKEWYDRVTKYDCLMVAVVAFNIALLNPFNILIGIFAWVFHELNIKHEIKHGKR